MYILTLLHKKTCALFTLLDPALVIMEEFEPYGTITPQAYLWSKRDLLVDSHFSHIL